MIKLLLRTTQPNFYVFLVQVLPTPNKLENDQAIAPTLITGHGLARG
jgi:hypothetical protein